MHCCQDGSIVSYETWLAALASSACIGFTSLVPWLFNLTFFEQSKKKNQSSGAQFGENAQLKLLLGFAVGAILGDIFFHLIPESFQSHMTELKYTNEEAHKRVGLSVIAGVFMFIIVQMFLENWSSPQSHHTATPSTQDLKSSVKTTTPAEAPLDDHISTSAKQKTNNVYQDLNEQKKSLLIFDNLRTPGNNRKWTSNNNNDSLQDLNTVSGEVKGSIVQTKAGDQLATNVRCASIKTDSVRNKPLEQARESSYNTKNKFKDNKSDMVSKSIDASGYLSLIANGFDNFTHGLAIGASFLVGSKVGLLTTFVIMVHEIPHEICDYAILVNSGFNRWDAVKAQSSVSLFGILGTATALYVKSVQSLTAKTNWILPFSAGGFLHIALVNLLPEILDIKSDTRNTVGQIACVILGVTFMAALAIV